MGNTPGAPGSNLPGQQKPQGDGKGDNKDTKVKLFFFN